MREAYIDTNVLIRYFIADIPEQFAIAKKLFEEIEEKTCKGYFSLLVINETIWIMEHYYHIERTLYIPQLLQLLLLPNIKSVEIKKDLLVTILSKMEHNSFDFTDMYLSHIAQPDTIVSFDNDFKKIEKLKL